MCILKFWVNTTSKRREWLILFVNCFCLILPCTIVVQRSILVVIYWFQLLVQMHSLVCIYKNSVLLSISLSQAIFCSLCSKHGPSIYYFLPWYTVFDLVDGVQPCINKHYYVCRKHVFLKNFCIWCTSKYWMKVLQAHNASVKILDDVYVGEVAVFNSTSSYHFA